VIELKDALAERLLANVMGWSPQDVANERPDLQALAAYKFDEYQQFSPGMRFIESLALWLKQFDTDEERKVAFNFVRNRLVFVSASEMAHLVAISYPDVIRPLLTTRVAKEEQMPDWLVSKIVDSVNFRVLLRQSLFLGLSDGSHTDVFRRSNPEISHEQVLRTQEISRERASEMTNSLRRDLESILGRQPSPAESRFRMVFLLDDFSGSGISYLRMEPEGSSYAPKGKIANFYRNVRNENGELSDLLSPSDLSVSLVLYMATEHAKRHLDVMGQKVFDNVPFTVHIVNLLRDTTNIEETDDAAFIAILKKYYDDSIETKHYLRGRHEKPYLGFDQCALPLVLYHNTPNNSVPLLWFDEGRRFRGLFPRVSRFRDAT
jgi:hypothetical protein